nr:MFS transporter [Nocardioides perillae]
MIALVEVLAMATWFSASAVVPALRADWGVGDAGAAALTVAVQLGFVAGALGSAALNLADRVPAHLLVAGSAALAAGSTAVIALAVESLGPAVALRAVTGVALAGVYPPGLKLMASWFDRGRGAALGVLVAALTLGSAAPQLLNAVAVLPWRGVLLVASSLAALAAVVAWAGVRPGPLARPAPPLAPRVVVSLLRQRGPRLATLGYLGHMWELYAVWTWLPAYLTASLLDRGLDATRTTVGLVSFAAIGVAGVAGCVVGGLAGDRLGRARVAGWAMRASAACCVLAAAVHGAHPALVAAVLAVWGFAVIADSGLFSTVLTEVVDPRYTGTALTTQTALGFLLTVVTINAVPVVVSATSWPVATLLLAAGPVVGAVAMARLDRSTRLAGSGPTARLTAAGDAPPRPGTPA